MKPKDLETIDPAALATVSGGAKRESSGGDGASDAVMTALTGILDSISSLASNKNSGMSPDQMMLFMMMMNRQNQVVAAAPQPTNWTWDANGGYWIVK